MTVVWKEVWDMPLVMVELVRVGIRRAVDLLLLLTNIWLLLLPFLLLLLRLKLDGIHLLIIRLIIIILILRRVTDRNPYLLFLPLRPADTLPSRDSTPLPVARYILLLPTSITIPHRRHRRIHPVIGHNRRIHQRLRVRRRLRQRQRQRPTLLPH